MPTSGKYKGFIFFALISIGCIFLSRKDFLQEFSSRGSYMQFNWRLIGLTALTDVLFLIVYSGFSVFLIKLYLAHLRIKTTYRDIFWYFAAIFITEAIGAILRLVGIFYMYLWVYITFRLITGAFLLLVMIEFYKYYKYLKSPLAPDNLKAILQAIDERFERIRKLLSNE